MKIIRQLYNISRSQAYWLLYLVGAMFALAVALYHQHGLDQPPCVLCIQVRLIMTLVALIAVFGLLTMRKRPLNIAAHVMMIATAIALAERSYQLLGTERGFLFGDCGFDLGLPAWFAIEEWLPWLYRVETSCGYTPEVAFGITMAEALMAGSVIFILLSVSVFIASFFPPRFDTN